MKNIITIIAAIYIGPFAICNIQAYAQPGSLDTTFGSGGKVITAIGGGNDYGFSVIIQPDGKILVVGKIYDGNSSDFALVRYNSDGTLDNTFGAGGKVITDIGGLGDIGRAVALQTDGKIIVTGYNTTGSNTDFALIRYNNNGTLDNSFGSGGKVTTAIGNSYDEGRSIIIQPDGKIIIAGRNLYTLGLVRYNSDGSLDNTFGNNGIINSGIGNAIGSGFGDYSVTLQSDNKIVVVGGDGDFQLARYNIDGTIDNTFGNNGIVTTDFLSSYDYASSIAIQNDGKIVVSGTSGTGAIWSNKFALARYDSGGNLDNTFGASGKVTTAVGNYDNRGSSIAIQINGKIVVAGYSDNVPGSNYDFELARYNNDGSLDNTFNSDGKVITDFANFADYGFSVAIQSDGKIVVAGLSYNGFNYDFALARYHGDSCLQINITQNPSICYGDSFKIGNNIYITPATYRDTLTSANGCDSIVTTNLTVLPNSSFTQSITIADGQTVTVGTHIYTTADTTGYYIDTLFGAAPNGCDSIVTTNLTVLNGINLITFQNRMVKIYPYPIANAAIIEIYDSQFSNGNLFIYDIVDQLVHRQTLISKHETLYLNLPSGIYFYKINNHKKEIIGIGKLLIH